MCEAMVQRQDNEHHRVQRNADYGMSLLHIGSVVPVSKEDTLRVSGSSRGVADVRVIVRLNRLVPLFESARMFCHELVAVFQDLRHRNLFLLILRKIVQDNDFLHGRNIFQDTSYLRKLCSGHHHET